MSKHPLDGYSKYETAKLRQPSSAALARKIFDYCYTHHKAVDGEPLRLRPEGDSAVIASEPNYFAFITINSRATNVTIDLTPSTFAPYANCFTPEELAVVNLKTRGSKGRRVQIVVETEEQLNVAFKILDFCHAWVSRGREVALSLFPQVRLASSQGQTRKVGSHRDSRGHN